MEHRLQTQKVKGKIMEITDKNIDSGKAFDWGRTSSDYAKYRDIYPQEFYDRILGWGLCGSGQKVLDLGTGTGVIPRNMVRYGAQWTGADISPEQIEQAKLLSQGSGIEYIACPTEKLTFPDDTFDTVTACQCYWYFDHKTTAPMLHRIIKKNGSFLILYMAWLPGEDAVADASEKLVLKYNPAWSGGGETFHPLFIPEEYLENGFELARHIEYRLDVPFTRESWNGRMKACRGIGASLSAEEVMAWEKEHMALLEDIAPEEFTIRHFAAMAELKKV